MNAEATETWKDLLEGNRRFREGCPRRATYAPTDLAKLAAGQRPKAAVIACSDSRVDPAIMFDQGLGDLFVSRVPGNIASDGAKWMVELAVEEFRVPLVVVLAHSGCLAVGSVLNWSIGGSGGFLRMHVLPSVIASTGPDEQKLDEAIRRNALNTVHRLFDECPAARAAAEEGRTGFIAAHYDLATGVVGEIG